MATLAFTSFCLIASVIYLGMQMVQQHREKQMKLQPIRIKRRDER